MVSKLSEKKKEKQFSPVIPIIIYNALKNILIHKHMGKQKQLFISI